MTDLVFDRLAPASSALVFGEGFVAPPTEITITGTLPALTVLVRMTPPAKLTITGTLPALTVAVEARYLTNTQRPDINQVRTLAQVATATEGGITQPGQHGLTTNSGFAAQWTEALASSSVVGVLAQEADPLTVRTDSTFTEGTIARTGASATAQNGDPQWLRFFSQFTEADRLAARRLHGQFEEGLRDRRPNINSRFQEATRRAAVRYRGTARPGVPVSRYWESLFQYARVPPPGQHVPPVIPPPQPEYWGTALVFMCPPLSAPHLVFGAVPCYVSNASVVVPVQRVYIVINSVTLRRVEGNVSIPTLSMNMSLDVDSWTWTASAALPGRALESVSPNLAGDPVEVEATFNGVAYRFLVESISRDRTFNISAIRIGMRGKTALLDAPYAPELNFGNTEARNMAQLVGDVLTFNGVPLDWTTTWTPEDWSVPTGAFSHQGTYISALNALAGAAGAYIMPHRTAQEITILPRYPTAPWAWASATPDYELPVDVAMQEGIEWVNRPLYNRVFVSGTSQGVLGQITRTGTAGDLVAPMITDALITDVIGARQRGLPVLADTGRVANVALRIPVLPSTGIIVPGKMIRYVDGATERIGISRSVSVSAGESGVNLKQTLQLETHE